MNWKQELNHIQTGFVRYLKGLKFRPTGIIALISIVVMALIIQTGHPAAAQQNVSGPFGSSGTPSLTVSGKTGPGHSLYVLGAHQTGGARNCGGNRQITNGWIIDVEAARYREAGVSANTEIATLGGYFLTGTGTFLTPYNGVYQVCMSARAETGAVDVSLRIGGSTRIAAVGTDLIQRLGDNSNFAGTWSSHSICRNVRLTAGQQLTMWMESGSSNDCTSETNFVYNTLDVNLLFAD